MRVRKWLAAATAAMVISGCGADGEVVTATTTTTVPETTTTTAAAPESTTSTSAPAPVASTTTEATTTTQSPAPSAMRLDSGSVDGISFGTPAGDAIDRLSDRLGGPDEDTGWEDYLPHSQVEFGEPGAFYEYDDYMGLAWEHPVHRRTCWASLCIVLGGSDVAAATLRGWEMYDASGAGGVGARPDARLADTDLGLGSTWGAIRSAFPQARVGGGEGQSLVIDGIWEGIFDGVGSWRLEGRWDYENPTYAPDDARLIRASAGTGPAFGCC